MLELKLTSTLVSMPPVTRQRTNTNDNQENDFPVRSRITRAPREPSANRGRGYRTRYLPAGDRNQEYLQEGVTVVARELVFGGLYSYSI